MNLEFRADGAHISGYVNVTEKKSRPVMTPHGKVVEEIEPRAFEAAIARAGNTHVYAETRNGSLQLREDDIGLHADVLIQDPTLIELARKGKVRGWSFGMYNVQDELEQRADALPLRRIKALDLDHITLVVNKLPVYSATSVELRADTETVVETRSVHTPLQISEPAAPAFDNSGYLARVNALNHPDKK